MQLGAERCNSGFRVGVGVMQRYECRTLGLPAPMRLPLLGLQHFANWI